MDKKVFEAMNEQIKHELFSLFLPVDGQHGLTGRTCPARRPGCDYRRKRSRNTR